MNTEAIETGLAEMKTHLDLIDGNIEQKEKRMAELKPLLDEAKTLKASIGKLKAERKSVSSKLNWLVEFFKGVNGGKFPDGMYPLFASQNTERKEVAHA